MATELHQVKENELPALKEWLQHHLPDSFKLYSTVSETLRGRWRGTSFVTLGWPHILAVGEGHVPSDSACYHYHAQPRTTSVFSPYADHLKTLLTWPEYLDWTQPIMFQVESAKLRHVIEKVARENEGQLVVKANVMLEAKLADLPLRPVPEEFTVRNLDPDLDTDYVMSTWPHSRVHSDTYIRETLRRFPSVGLFDKNGTCIGLEIGNEYGAMGMLHVREEYRGRGLGKVITSQLAHKYFAAGLSAVAMVIKINESSIRMHENCGFEKKCDVDWLIYLVEDMETYLNRIGYKERS